MSRVRLLVFLLLGFSVSASALEHAPRAGRRHHRAKRHKKAKHKRAHKHRKSH